MNAPDFMRELFTGSHGVVELAYIAPAGSSLRPHIRWDHYAIGGARRIDWPQVHALNAQGYSVYYGVSTKKRVPDKRACEADTAMIPALWVEIDLKDGDYATKADAVRAVNDLLPFPTVIIDSGGGIHALWKIAPVAVTRDNRDLIKRTLRGMALLVKGDTSVAETARVLRLPGTVNTKPDRGGAVCTVLDAIPGGHYTLDQFTEYAVAPARVERVRIDLPAGARTKLPAPTRSYLEHGAPEGKRNLRLYAATIDYRDNGYTFSDAERELGARARADGLAEHEIARTIESGWKSKHGGGPNVDRTVSARLRALSA